MNYINWIITIIDVAQKDILTQQLWELPILGLEELEDDLCISSTDEAEVQIEIKDFLVKNNITFTIEEIPNQNWNAAWESNFEPVIIGDFCAIRASFHQPISSVAHEIIITPQMSFGTGHHATTSMMVEKMADVDFIDQSVLDFGTGTGVLAILSEKLGATTVLAIDNDEWSIINATDNVQHNECSFTKVSDTPIDALTEKSGFNIILANINRHILLEYMAKMSELLKDKGSLLLSGILDEDQDIIVSSAQSQNLQLTDKKQLKGWLQLTFEKMG